MFDFLFKKNSSSKSLDNILFFNYALSEEELLELQAPENEKVRQALLSACEKLIAQNLYAISHGQTKTDEERGVYMGVVRVYEDLINIFTKKKDKEDSGYTDILKKIKAVT